MARYPARLPTIAVTNPADADTAATKTIIGSTGDSAVAARILALLRLIVQGIPGDAFSTDSSSPRGSGALGTASGASTAGIAFSTRIQRVATAGVRGGLPISLPHVIRRVRPFVSAERWSRPRGIGRCAIRS